MYSDIEKPQSGVSAILTPVLILGGLGVGGYFIYKAWDKKRADKETQKAVSDKIKNLLDIKKRDARINTIESKAYVKGTNAFNKDVNINLITAVKEAINGFYLTVTDKYGTVKYIRKSNENINQAKVKSAFFNVPLNAVAKFDRAYTAYTGKSFINDCQNLDIYLYKQIKAIFEVAHKNYPKTFF